MTAIEGKVDDLAIAIDRIEKKMDLVASLPSQNAVAITTLENRLTKLEGSQLGNRVATVAWIALGIIIAGLVNYALTH